MILKLTIFFFITEVVICKLVVVNDKNDLKKELKSHANILILFHDNDRSNANVLKLFEDVSESGSKIAKLITIDCKANKKLCKQYKVDSNNAVIQHFHKGKFNRLYDRKLRPESLMRFLEDPKGDIPWEEEDTAKDVFHVKALQDLQKLVQGYKNNAPTLMLMFYAPWCGHCKKMKPEFAAAATSLKSRIKFIGINGDIDTTEELKQAFNVTGYPSVFLLRDGNKIYKFDSANTKEELIKFAENPIQPTTRQEVPWSEETTEIDFLTELTFYDFLSEHKSVLVLFYAPWCGHCKAIKPEIIEAAKELKRSKTFGRFAAIDATEAKNISQAFNVTGYPMLKYFKDGDYQFDINERKASGLLRFILDPQKPKDPERPIPWNEEESAVHHPNADDFRPTLKKYKHSLVMFYAPWCGHCKKAKPGFTAAANEMKDNVKVAFVAVDCTSPDYSTVCKTENVEGFPTLRYYNYGKITSYSDYTLDREQADFIAFMTDPMKPMLDARRHWKHIPDNDAVVVLDTESFAQHIVSQTSGALVMFYAPWCGHCNAMKPAFVAAAKALKASLPSCILGSVDATTETNLAAQYKIDGFPTLIYFSPSGDWSVFKGGRNEKDFIEFMLKKDSDIKYDSAEKERQDIEEKERKVALEKQMMQKEEERKQKEVEERKLAEERRQKQEEERKQKEETERKLQEEKIRKQEEEKKQKDETERKLQEEKLRKQEEERKQKKETERIHQEEERKQKEETEKRLQEEKLRNQEQERKQREETERKLLEGKIRKQEEEKKQKEETERRLQEEKLRKQEEERKQSEETERKLREEKIRKQEEEKKQKEDTERRLREEKIRKQEEERKQNEENEKRLKEEENVKKKDEERMKQKESGKSESGHLIKVSDTEEFWKRVNSVGLSVVYFHKGDKKNHLRQKVVRFLEKHGEERGVVSLDVDCNDLIDLCDQLAMAQLPSLLYFQDGAHTTTLSDKWTDEDFQDLLAIHRKQEL